MDQVKLKFLGAYSGVTGSKTLLSYHHKDILVDCGLFQGSKDEKKQNWDAFPTDAKTISAVFLTHAHLDHCGYLPRLWRSGFRGPIYCTRGTARLTRIILEDAAHLESELADYANQTGYSHHKNPLPLFTSDDVKEVLKLIRVVRRNEWVLHPDGYSYRFLRAGHIIGASFVQLQFPNDQSGFVVTFSGDLGNYRSLVMKGPSQLPATDVLVMESTYGNRLHSADSALSQLRMLLNKVIQAKGVAVIPAFAVGRSQEILYLIGRLEADGTIPKVDVILDSPMAEAALEIFLSHSEDHTADTLFKSKKGNSLPAKFRMTKSVDESMVATMRDGPAIIISASGMLSGGRVLHHLKKRLPHAENMVIFTGYQAENTKGRYLLEHATHEGNFRIFHQEIPVAASIHMIDSLSCHADYEEIVSWIRQAEGLPKTIILNHGEKEAQEALALRLKDDLHIPTTESFKQQEWCFQLVDQTAYAWA